VEVTGSSLRIILPSGWELEGELLQDKEVREALEIHLDAQCEELFYSTVHRHIQKAAPGTLNYDYTHKSTKVSVACDRFFLDYALKNTQKIEQALGCKVTVQSNLELLF